MRTIDLRRVAAAVAGGLVSVGILAGGMAAGLSSAPSYSLADYGSSVTAENGEKQAESKGVPHMSDHRSSPRYFEEMDGGQ